MLKNPPVYDDLCPNEELLRDDLGQDLEFSSNGNSVSVSSLPPKLRVLTIVMFHNLYLLSSTGYMNLGRALFLHDLISDVEIDICAHIFHVMRKTVLRIESRICVPFCCLISRILKLKGILPIAMSLPTQNRVRSTCVHSTQALVIVERESNRKLPHLTMVHTLAHYPLMKNSTTLWHLFMSWVPRCQNSHLFYTITTPGGIWSLPPYKLNWIRFKRS